MEPAKYLNIENVGQISLDSIIENGSYGPIYKSIEKEKNNVVTIKVFGLRTQYELENIKEESHRIALDLKHSNILNYFSYTKVNHLSYLIMEYADEGSLFIKVLDMKRIDSYLAKRWFEQIIKGIRYIHHKGIIHRSIDYSNVLICKDKVAKLSDFKFATFNYDKFGNENVYNYSYGTVTFLSPEAYHQKKHKGIPVDIWAAGMLLMVMLFGFEPWDCPLEECIYFRQWKDGHYYSFIKEIQDLNAMDLLKKLLNVRPSARPSADTVLEHSFFTSHSC